MTKDSTSFTLAAVLEALQQRRQFLLVQVRLAETPVGYHVTIPSATSMATTPAGRKAFESDKNAWRWAAGGGLVILDCSDRSVALVRHRDAGAPSYGDHWTLGSGLASSVEELLHPDRIAVREALEEFIIATPGGIVIPVFGNDNLDPVAYGAVGSSHVLRKKSGLNGMFGTQSYLEASTSFTDVNGEGYLEVALEGGSATLGCRGIVVIDSATRGIDFLKVMRISVPFPFREIAVFDGEDDREGNPLNAEIGCLAIQGRVVDESRPLAAVFQGGIRRESSGINLRLMTPPLAAILSAMMARE